MKLSPDKPSPAPGGIRGDIGVIITRSLVALALAVLYAFIAAGASSGLDISNADVLIPGLPQELDGLRIAHLSDFHSSQYGEGQHELLEAVSAFHPDVIALTGDVIDGRSHTNSTPCIELVRGLAAIAPVYWVRGNHEYYLDTIARAQFEQDMVAAGAVLLDNDAAVLERNGIEYLVSGMNDVDEIPIDLNLPADEQMDLAMEYAKGFMEELKGEVSPQQYPLQIMLCHMPFWWSLWKEAGYHLALSGHLHGWIVRLPAIGGVLRNPVKFFPEEDAGLYDKQGIWVYISRGLANIRTIRNIRLNNRPELALISVRAAD